jgi:hypothetical protein
MAGRWQGLADQLNDIFTDVAAQKFKDFQTKFKHENPNRNNFHFGKHAHLKDAKGGSGGGNQSFMSSERDRHQFMIDSGSRNWDGPSLSALEDTVYDAIVTNPRKLEFTVTNYAEKFPDDLTKHKNVATASIQNQGSKTVIEIVCPVGGSGKADGHSP